mgnify:CR=1 FL=1
MLKVSSLIGFIAGFFATLTFHQGAVAALNIAGVVPMAPFNMVPTWPLGVPLVLSMAFWGGIWGILIHAALKTQRGAAYWGGWVVIGAIGPTAVSLLVVFPLKGMDVTLVMIPVGLLFNSLWGLGSAFFLRIFKRIFKRLGVE